MTQDYSRSMQRRMAVQKGKPMPEFDNRDAIKNALVELAEASEQLARELRKGMRVPLRPDDDDG